MGSSIYMTLAAMVLLSVFILSTNSLIQKSTVTVDDSEYFITAISLAQNVIDEAKTKEFDEKTISGSIDDAKKLTSSLGREDDEEFRYPDVPDTVIGQIFSSTKLYDDFDDYNGYKRVVDTKRAESFAIYSIVEYVNPENPDEISPRSEPTFCKRMTVLVTSPFLENTTVKLQYAMTY